MADVSGGRSTPDRPAIDRALTHISEYEKDELISPEMARRSREVVRQLFTPDTCYTCVAPIDDGDVSFYWIAGDRSISIDLYAEGGCWMSVRNGEKRMRHCSSGDVFEQWMRHALDDFSAHVQRVNPAWREQKL